MAGLGLFDHLSARALAPRGLLRSAYDFLCLIYAKCPRASWNAPGQFRPTLEATRKKTFFGPPSEALVTPFSMQKPVKNHFCRLTIQEPIFSVSNTEFEGGDDGHGHGDYTFLVKQAQPSHSGPVTPAPGSLA